MPNMVNFGALVIVELSPSLRSCDIPSQSPDHWTDGGPMVFTILSFYGCNVLDIKKVRSIAGTIRRDIVAPMADGVRIDFEGLGKRYDRRVIFRGVSGAAAPGSVLVLTGPNGSGKSTLMLILTGLLRATRGTVNYSQNGIGIPRADWRLHLGIVAPAMALYEELTARENLAFFARVRGRGAGADTCDELITMVGLDPERKTPVAGYSTGMQQRLKIAQAVLHDPAVLFLDEPGSNLDPGGQDWLEQWVSSFAESGKTVILATNDLREMQWGSRRVELVG